MMQKRWWQRSGKTVTRAVARARWPRWARPRLEPLEDRLVLSNLLVNNPTDAHVNNQLSLREALAQANADAAAGTADTITFAAGLAGQTISLTQGQLEVSGV